MSAPVSCLSIPGRKNKRTRLFKYQSDGCLHIQPQYFIQQPLRKCVWISQLAALIWQVHLHWTNHFWFGCNSFGSSGCIAPVCFYFKRSFTSSTVQRDHFVHLKGDCNDIWRQSQGRELELWVKPVGKPRNTNHKTHPKIKHIKISFLHFKKVKKNNISKPHCKSFILY